MSKNDTKKTKKEIEHEIRERDYQDGRATEFDMFEWFRQNQNHCRFEYPHRFNFYDLKACNDITNKQYATEIKKRYVTKDRYDTTIVPFSKVREYKRVKEQFEDFLFVFCFTDGNYYITYNELCKLKKHDKRIQVRSFQRFKSYTHKAKKHLFIPCDLLKPLDTLKIL